MVTNNMKNIKNINHRSNIKLRPSNTVCLIEPSSRENRKNICINIHDIEMIYSKMFIFFCALNIPIINDGINKIELISIAILSSDPDE
jgi:hypothetical protein